MDYSASVLAAIIPNRRDNLLRALEHLEPEHFRVETHKNIFALLERYYGVAAGVMPKKILSDVLRRAGRETDVKDDESLAKAILYEELYDDLAQPEVSDHEFRYAIDALRDQHAEQQTSEVITTTFEILEVGVEVDRQFLKGHRQAREFAYQKFAAIDRLEGLQFVPEGFLHDDAQETLLRYTEAKAHPDANRVLTGIKPLDEAVGGMRSGELVLVCGSTAQGKSMFVTQIAWHAAVIQGKNTLFFTTETVREQVRRRLIARHSNLPNFGLSEGLDTRKIRDGLLNAGEEEVLMSVVSDLVEGTNENRYGMIYIAQLPRGATIGTLEAKLRRQAAGLQVDLVVVDHLMLLTHERTRASKREELNDILLSAKLIATSFGDGQGVPLVSPWHVNRAGQQDAHHVGEYMLSALAETSEAERMADQVLTLLRLDDPREVRLQVLKNRDGALPNALHLAVDFRSASFEAPPSIGAVDDLLEMF